MWISNLEGGSIWMEVYLMAKIELLKWNYNSELPVASEIGVLVIISGIWNGNGITLGKNKLMFAWTRKNQW